MMNKISFAVLIGLLLWSSNGQSQSGSAAKLAPVVNLVLSDAEQVDPVSMLAVSFVNPRNNNRFVEGNSVSVTVSASDRDGQVARVDLYVDDALIGSDAAAPYSWSLANLSLGEHTLRAIAFDNDGLNTSTEISITIVEDTTDAGGFTKIVASSDSRVMYVSSSQGSDVNNTCQIKAAPCATIAKAISFMRNGFPDHVLLKRGDRWRIERPFPYGLKRYLDGLKRGRSSDEPAVLGYYGDTGPRPLIEGDEEIYRQDRTGSEIKHFHWIGLHFYAYKKDPSHPEFERGSKNPELSFVGGFDDVLLEDNKFEFSGLVIQANTAADTQPSNFRVRRNIFSGAYSFISSYSRKERPSLVFTYWVDGLDFEENVFDQGGWNPNVLGAGANQLSHNVYLQWRSNGNKTFFRNNISTRAASHGVQMRSGGLAQDNFFARNALGLLMGYNYGGREVPTGVRAHAIDNVIIEGTSMYRGVDPCTGPENVCSGAIWGLDVNVMSDADYQAHGNIVSRISPHNNEPNVRTFNRRAIAFQYKNGRTTFPNSNNIIYKWKNDNKPDPVEPNYLDPDRGLGDYNATLGGENSFDAFMQVVLNRPVGTWDSRYEAKSINAYIRAGFEIN